MVGVLSSPVVEASASFGRRRLRVVEAVVRVHSSSVKRELGSGNEWRQRRQSELPRGCEQVRVVFFKQPTKRRVFDLGGLPDSHSGDGRTRHTNFFAAWRSNQVVRLIVRQMCYKDWAGGVSCCSDRRAGLDSGLYLAREVAPVQQRSSGNSGPKWASMDGMAWRGMRSNGHLGL